MSQKFFARIYGKCFHTFLSGTSRISSVYLNETRLFLRRLYSGDGTFRIPIVELDTNYFDDPSNQTGITENLRRRNMSVTSEEIIGSYGIQLSLPNETHCDVIVGDKSQARLMETVGQPKCFPFNPNGIVHIGERLGMLRTSNVGHTTGPRTYYFLGQFAQLENALIQFTVNELSKKGFQLLAVPNLIHPKIIEGCGFKTTGERNQIYRLRTNHGEVCLAGTGEMPIAGYLANTHFKRRNLPLKYMTLSRCYRAETSDLEEERGIYRVHQFNKVEMFGVTTNDPGASQELMNYFLKIQKELFSELDLHMRILDMPTEELGPPAFRKYDIEAWMPAKNMWGEISSTSNCTDFQSRRLNMKYTESSGDLRFCHTVNGTACAVPRLMMAIVESGQNEHGQVELPTVIKKYMNGASAIKSPDNVVKYKWLKLTKHFKRMMKSSRTEYSS